MTKSELKDLVRGIIQEELRSLNGASLTEAGDMPKRPGPVKTGSPTDLAVKIYNSAEFATAFAEDGFILGDAVEELIKSIVAKYPSKEAGSRVIAAVRAKLRYLVREHDLDSVDYDDSANAIAQRYFKAANNF